MIPEATIPFNPDTLSARLKALAHPARLKVLETLAHSEGCQCGEIVAGLPLAQSTVSQHIRVLLEAGFVRGEANGARSCYCIDHDALRALRSDLDALFSALAASPSGVANAPQK